MARVFRDMSPTLARNLSVTASFLFWAPVGFFFWDNVYQVAAVRGASMYPSLNYPGPPGSVVGAGNSNPTYRDQVIMSMWDAASRAKRGDVIAFWTPSDPNKMVVKRIVAVEGDEVQTYRPYPFPKQIVPQGHVWVEGDQPERRFTRDSNDYGPIPRALITAKVVARIWPNITIIGSEKWEEDQAKAVHRRIRRNVVKFKEEVISI